LSVFYAKCDFETLLFFEVIVVDDDDYNDDFNDDELLHGKGRRY